MVPAEFIRLKEIKIWPYIERALHRNSGTAQGIQGKMALAPKSHNSVSSWVSLSPPKSAQTSLRDFQEKLKAGPGWLQPADFSIGQELGRAGPLGVKRVGQVHSPRRMPYEKECLTQER